MKFAYINQDGRIETACNDDTVKELPDGAFALTEEQFETRFDLVLIKGKLVNKPIVRAPEELMEKAISAVKFALQSAIDTKARGFGFNNGNSFMLYAGFTNPFKANALVFAQWEASVWAEAEAYKAEILAGKAPMLSPEEAVAMMPVYPT